MKTVLQERKWEEIETIAGEIPSPAKIWGKVARALRIVFTTLLRVFFVAPRLVRHVAENRTAEYFDTRAEYARQNWWQRPF